MATELVPHNGPIVTRAQAKAVGLKHYFTGKLCKHGHLSERITRDGSCPPCRLIFKVDPDKRRARQERYEAANGDKIRARGRKYSREHREQSNAWAAVPENREKKNATTRLRYEQTKASEPAKLKAKWRRDLARDPKAAVARTIRWQAANVAELKAYRLANRVKISRRGKEWALANPERMRAKGRKWRLNHPEAKRRWREANPEAARAIKQNRRARERAAEGRHTAAELRALFAKQKGRCVYCRAGLRKGYDADHIQPLSRGGSNWITNIQLLCEPCNSRKWATDPIEYARRVGLLL
jgi:5-methylcytosine-specific restriction endonuclease McrA